MANSCNYHRDCGTTQACQFYHVRKCVDLCFSENCNQEVNNARDRLGFTPLFEAARTNRVAVAKLLIENSAHVNSINSFHDSSSFCCMGEQCWSGKALN